jgi:hypothetical protein
VPLNRQAFWVAGSGLLAGPGWGSLNFPKPTYLESLQQPNILRLSKLWAVAPMNAIDGIRVNTCLRVLNHRLWNPTED